MISVEGVITFERQGSSDHSSLENERQYKKLNILPYVAAKQKQLGDKGGQEQEINIGNMTRHYGNEGFKTNVAKG
jgi:hypothetical protein